MRSRVRLLALAGLVIACGSLSCDAYVRYLQFPLAGHRDYGSGSGQVKFSESFGDADRSDGATLIVEVKNVPLPAGTELTVEVDGKEVGTFKLDKLRNGRFILESGKGKVVPRLSTSSLVTVVSIHGELCQPSRASSTSTISREKPVSSATLMPASCSLRNVSLAPGISYTEGSVW